MDCVTTPAIWDATAFGARRDRSRVHDSAPSSGGDESRSSQCGHAHQHDMFVGGTMAQHAASSPAGSPSLTSRHSGAWVGWIAFAGTMMIMLGGFHIIQGLVALFND